MKIIYFFIVLFFFSCKNNNESLTPSLKIDNDNNPTIVECDSVRNSDFFLELNTTGKAFAKRKVELKFMLDEKVNLILVKNGQYVSKGELLAKQDNTLYRNKIIKAKEQLERARIDVEDILIGFNYSFQDSINIPVDIFNMSKNRGNYNSSISNLNDAKNEFSSTLLKSPINGIIANLNAKNFSYPDKIEPFCTIIDNTTFEVEFSVIEDDYIYLIKGQPIEISTLLNNESIKGEITEINPTVDKNGMIEVKGIIKNVPENMIDGINVNIIIKKKISDKLSVPNESIVLRDNKKVIFTFKAGLAVWNYVETSYESYDFTVVEKGINKDDIVIKSGNVNLAHNSTVIIDNE